MSVTDKLRKFADDRTFLGNDYMELYAIADHIDTEYEEAIQQALMGEGGVPATDENMAKHGWVRGPLDADGKMWHSGDMSDSNWGVIEGIAYGNGRWLVRGHDTSAPWIPADSIRHYHAPTVEDMLNEMLNEAFSADFAYRSETIEAMVAEYATKLQLKEN